MGGIEAKVKITADVDGTEKVTGLRKEIDGLRPAGDSARTAASQIDEVGSASERAAGKAAPAHRKISDGVQSISTQLGELKTAYIAWESAQAAMGAAAGLAATADAWANLTARVKMAVGEGDAFKQAFQGVQDVALRTGASLEATGNLFVKLADAGKQMGIGQAEALRLTETVNQAIQLSGASAQSSEAAVTQLIQGLQGGVLRGDEFNSVMEQSPRLAKALADGLGVTTGELRKMAEAGQLSAQTVIGALQGQARAVESEFSKLPPTIGRAITELDTHWQVWLGHLDESTGTSAAVASAISSLAQNFDLVASSLINAGQAYLGWKAYNIAAEFLALQTAVGTAAAAKVADTAATAANTVATSANAAAVAANTSAQVANAKARQSAMAASVSAYMLTGTAATTANTAATVANTAATAASATAADAAAAGAGRLATALNLMKGLSLAFLVTNLDDIGKAMGEGAAKAMGYGKMIEENERQMRAAERAARDMAAADAELAQKKKLAADAALGLSKEAKKLVADFNDLREKGESADEALSKIGKDLDLSNIKGIADAGAALDALAQRGKISAEQVQDAWEGALKDVDLQVFEVNVRAAFDSTEQGARRLAAALDAQLGEALRRTGKDWGTLAGGVNDAAQKSINSFDVLAERVDEIRAKGLDAGLALSASLDQAAKAATTEQAARAVLERWEQLGQAGLVTGDRLAEGLAKARRQLDDVTPGINSVEEAMGRLGLKSQEALSKTAASAKEAFDYIKANGGAVQEQQAAWTRYAEAAKAANGGVLPDLVRVQGELLKVGDAGRNAGAGVRDGMTTAGSAVQKVLTDAERLANRLQALKGAGLGDNFGNQSTSNGTYDDLRRAGVTPQQMAGMGYSQREIEDYVNNADKAPQGYTNRSVTSSGVNTYQMGVDAGLNDAEAKKLGEIYGYYAAKANTEAQRRAGGDMGLTFGGDDYVAVTREYANLAIAEARRLVAEENQKNGTTATWGPAPKAVTVNININGRNTPVTVTDQSQADNLTRALQEALAAKS